MFPFSITVQISRVFDSTTPLFLTQNVDLTTVYGSK